MTPQTLTEMVAIQNEIDPHITLSVVRGGGWQIHTESQQLSLLLAPQEVLPFLLGFQSGHKYAKKCTTFKKMSAAKSLE